MVDIVQSYAGGDYGRTATQNAQPFKGIVIHVTGKPDLKSEMDYMGHPDPNRPGYYGYHYLIDTDGAVYHTAPDNVRTNHIMPNGQSGLNNSNALGVAFVGGAKGATPSQIDSGKALVGQLTSQFGIKPNMVVSHGELDPETRGPGHGLGANDTAEGADFINAYRGNQPAPAPSAVAGTSINTTGPSRPVTASPSATLSSPMDLVANLESGNRNIPQGIVDANTARGTPAGGYFQIIDPTWQRYGATAGIDLTQYPTAMSAPRNVQAQVASAIPVDQWGPNTVNALKAKYPGIDTSQTLGAVQSAVLNGGSGAPGPIDPSIIAHGGYSPPIPSTPGTTINSTPAAPAGVSQAQQTQLAQNVKKMLGLPDDDSQGQQQIKPLPMIGPQPQARNVSPLLGNPQLYAQRMAAISQPMTWGAAPPGQMAGTGYGVQAQPSVYGTSLMSNLQRLSDPMWMNQMAGGSYG